MTDHDKPFLVEWVWLRKGECSKNFYEKMSIKELEHYYLDMLGEGSE